MNEYYNETGIPATNAYGHSADIRNEYGLVENGFDKLPVLSGHGGEIVRVNMGGTAIETVATFTDGSVIETEHRHSKLVSPDGSIDPALEVNNSGQVIIAGHVFATTFAAGPGVIIHEFSANPSFIGASTVKLKTESAIKTYVETELDDQTHFASDITNFDAEVANNSAVAANTAASHPESHTIASHSDTTSTGAELETLTDGSNADSLHAHSRFISSSGQSVFVGTNAGISDDGSNNYNVAVGHDALYSNITGSTNAALGYQSLYFNTVGSYNTASGYQSLYSSTESDCNTASGYQSLYSSTVGGYNAALGYQSLHYNTEGSCNAASGYKSLYSNITGSANTASGYESLLSSTESNGNTASGYKSLYSNTVGDSNTASGYQSLYSNTVGGANSALGFCALFDVSAGNNNTGIGRNTGRGITSGDNNTILGANVTGLAPGLEGNVIIADGQGNIRFQSDSAGAIFIGGSLEVNGSEIDFSNLPTTDPSHAGRLWNDAGTVKISAG